MRLGWLAVIAALLFSTASAAEEPYLYDVMKKPVYRRAWIALIHGQRRLPTWLGQVTAGGNYVATPATPASVNGTAYRLFHACKAHDCAGNEIEVMFTEDGEDAWAMLINHSRHRYLGAPDADQQGALAHAMKQ